MTHSNPFEPLVAGGLLSRRAVLALGGGLAAATTLSACGKGGGAGGGSGTLEIWANSAMTEGESGLKKAAEAFGEANDVEVTVQGLATKDLVPKLTTTVSGGSGPDVAIVDTSSVPQLAQSEVLADVSDKAKGVADQFVETALEYSTYDGKQFGLPYDSNNVALFYNKGMLDEKGISAPTTWDELRDAAIELTGGGQYGYMLGAQGYGSFLFWPWLWQNGGSILSDDVSQVEFDNELGIEAWQFYADLWLKDKVVPEEFVGASSSWDEFLAPFIQGKVAMLPMGPWGISPIAEGNPDLELGFAPLPQKTEAASILGGTTVSVSAKSKNADLAWQFAEWCTSADQVSYIQDQGRIPARKDVVDSDWASEEESRKVFVEQMEVSRARPAIPIWGDIEWGTVANAWDAVIQGQQSPADALKAAAEETAGKL